MTDPNQPSKYRLRLVFAKKSRIKYISHLDLALVWERALRRARIPLAYSQGFNPRPKMQFASGLPLGATGVAEILDIVVNEPISPAEVSTRIGPALPAGLQLHSVEQVPLKSPTLQSLLRQAKYRVLVETDLPAETLIERIDKLLAADKLIQTRRRRKKEEAFDLRPWLHELRLESVAAGEACLQMRLTAGQFGNLRPEEVLKTLDLADNWAEIERTRLIFEDELPFQN
jgi:radical SAM-linked protein